VLLKKRSLFLILLILFSVGAFLVLGLFLYDLDKQVGVQMTWKGLLLVFFVNIVLISVPLVLRNLYNKKETRGNTNTTSTEGEVRKSLILYDEDRNEVLGGNFVCPKCGEKSSRSGFCSKVTCGFPPLEEVAILNKWSSRKD